MEVRAKRYSEYEAKLPAPIIQNRYMKNVSHSNIQKINNNELLRRQ